MVSKQPDHSDHWSSELYSSAAKFVPKLTSKVVSYLNAGPTDKILDLGCGDGQLTSQIHQSGFTTGCICGLDASQSMIESAREKYSSKGQANISFHVQDCARFDEDAKRKYLDGQWDKVFSNAAMHWILRDPEVRTHFFENVHKALRPGGLFVFEQGGFGNVAEAHAALIAAVIAEGHSPLDARKLSPWFFPTQEWMRGALENAGFVVEKLEMEYRPTPLTAEDKDGRGGLEGWVRMFGASFLELASDKETMINRVIEILSSIITWPDDGTQSLGYVRLRSVARKKA